MSVKLLTRDEFRETVLLRDKNKCVLCPNDAVAVHHIIERKLFCNGGYFVDNGAALCEDCHWKAEMSLISCGEIRCRAGIFNLILPEGFDHGLCFDKWGNEFVDDKTRRGGPLYPQEKSMVDLLRKAGIHFI